MNEAATIESSEKAVERVLRAELAQGDAALGTIGPVLGHLLVNHDNSLFSDEIVSRVRGMLADLARQMLTAQAASGAADDPRGVPETACTALTDRLCGEKRLVQHCHALALEGQLTARLEKRSAIDPVLSPLLQALIASDDSATASTAMAVLAAQARFVQNQRRMQLPLGELPADLFHIVIGIWTDLGKIGEAQARSLETLRRTYDEAASRIGLLARLVAKMGAGSRAALAIDHSGPAVFLSALAAALQHDRDLVAVVTNDRQMVRLALSLRVAGLRPREVEEQFLHIHPDSALPDGFALMGTDRAASLLAASGRSEID